MNKKTKVSLIVSFVLLIFCLIGFIILENIGKC